MGKIKNNGKEKKENIKGNRKKRNEGRVLWVFLSLIHVTKSGEAILPNFLLKWFQLHPKSASPAQPQPELPPPQPQMCQTHPNNECKLAFASWSATEALRACMDIPRSHDAPTNYVYSK
jgi:hypothetical protein